MGIHWLSVTKTLIAAQAAFCWIMAERFPTALWPATAVMGWEREQTVIMAALSWIQYCTTTIQQITPEGR
jgi:hypothetical protein